jgi:anti-sigma28 factor (negative regulator of flagellin synthesis)
MKTEIVNEIARLMRAREPAPAKDAKEIKAKKEVLVRQDEVALSSTAQSFAAKTAGVVSELEKEQMMKVERLKALVNGGNYKMDDGMVTSIAERIANTLV